MYDGYGIGAGNVAVLNELEQELGRPIRVFAARGRTVTPEQFGEWTTEQRAQCGDVTQEHANQTGLTIAAYATVHAPRTYHNVTVPERLLGEYWTETGYEEYPVYDVVAPPASPHLAEVFLWENLPMGEITDRLICFYADWFPFTNRPGNDRRNLFNTREWLTEAVRICCDEERMTQYREAMANRERNELARYIRDTSNEGVTQLRNEIGQMEARLARAIEQKARYTHDLRQKQRHLDTLLDDTDEGKLEKIQEAWDRLKADDRIDSITFVDGQLVIQTGPIDIVHPISGVSAYLGRFRWLIDIANSSITVINTDNAKGGYDHPHVFQNRPCFGEMGETVYTLLRQGHLAESIEMVFAFLGSVNLHDDWSRRASFWLEQAMREAEQPAEAVA